jgi:predicted acyl esterase
MADPQRWFLHSGGGADTRPSDGTLSTVAATMEPVDSFNCGTSAEALGDVAHGLRYASPVFVAPLAVDGAVIVDLYAVSSSVVEFTAMIVDHGPDRRDNFVGSATASPGDTDAPVTLEFGEVAHTFGVGHRLHLDITATSREGLAALQVFHDAVHPSCLTLPVCT